MLGKLLKYEIKSTSRTFLPFYAALVIMALISRLFLWIDGKFSYSNIDFSTMDSTMYEFAKIPKTIAITSFVAIMVAIFVVTIVVTIQRFYKNLLCDEGYLMFTLPVETWKNITCKFIVSALWIFVSVIVSMFALVFTLFTPDMWADIGELFYELHEFFLYDNGWLWVTEFILAGITSLFAFILQVYASIAVGQLFNTHKLIASFGAYFVINIVLQVVSSVGTVIFASGAVYNDATTFLHLFHPMLISQIIVNIICCVVFFIGTNWILSKKLNLE